MWQHAPPDQCCQLQHGGHRSVTLPGRQGSHTCPATTVAHVTGSPPAAAAPQTARRWGYSSSENLDKLDFSAAPGESARDDDNGVFDSLQQVSRMDEEDDIIPEEEEEEEEEVGEEELRRQALGQGKGGWCGGGCSAGVA